MWIYSISKQTLYSTKVKRDGSRTRICDGYSGVDEGLNSIDGCEFPFGPPPLGNYYITDGYWDEKYGPSAIVISPRQGTDVSGREGTIFTIHGDIGKLPIHGRNALVLPKSSRDWMIWSTDRQLLIEP